MSGIRTRGKRCLPFNNSNLLNKTLKYQESVISG
ncbi:hypothetical protein Goklo_005194 [Gossypium klotzschianum]|uniref:Uncharacterized protein n=1 Tax=Gossypium klotzschianum TaxID=34286 RepID=A0A7J8VRS3_9ROSI|nr:hypothetical protein [Gossypium klotzschianum]